MGDKSKQLRPHWFSKNPSKRWGDLFFLIYTPIWIGLFGGVVATKLYERFGDVEYMILGLLVSVPCVLYPLLFPGEADKKLPITQQYWLKANLWILLFNFVGNYFWTHYFFVLLGAKYTFPITWELNKIPIPLFFITQAYFHTYHVLSNLLLRRYYTSFAPSIARKIGGIVIILVLSYLIALAETVTIQSVPYYTFVDRNAMYVIGSTFYGLYFAISFPMFLRLDENPGENWSLSKTALDSLAAAMIVFILCDFWRLLVGTATIGGTVTTTLPFL